jgi:hypothetical protein
MISLVSSIFASHIVYSNTLYYFHTINGTGLTMNELLAKLLDSFRGKVNLLLVDDDRHVLKSLSRNFTSPAFALTSYDSFTDAIRSLRRSDGAPWHCWVLDMDLGEGKTGIDIMKTDGHFPYILILSGLQSMRVAAEAVKQGALAVFDKDPDSFERLYDETCKIAALGYLLGGKATQYLPTYRLLCDTPLRSPDEWAEKACVSLRQLHRICDIHPIDNPKGTISLFYALYLLLWKGKTPYSDELPASIKPSQVEFYTECVDYCVRKF